MDFISILTVVAGVLGAVLPLILAFVARQSNEEAKQALLAAREPRIDQALRKDDLKGLGDYFFRDLGRLPLADYANDTEARRIVSDAVRNVESFLNADRPSTDVSASVRVDAKRAEADIAAGDFWGGLSRLRRAIEIVLRDAATTADVPMERMGPNQLLKRLVREEVVPRSAAELLRRSISICNRGVHGEPVSGDEAEEALALAAEGLAAIRDV